MPPEERMSQILAREQLGEESQLVLFWGHSAPASGRIGPYILSQWYQAPFEVEGRTYITSEHYMMASKAALFGDYSLEAKVLEAKSPREAKSLGRQVTGFDEGVWARRRCELVVEGNVAKFSQHRDLAEYLLATGDNVLVEASPTDRIWGIGLPLDDCFQ